MASFKSISAKKEFDLIYKKGRSFSGNFFSLRVLAQKNKEEETKFSVIIGIKVSKKAVVRNRKKRQLKEIIRINYQKISKGYLCLVIAKPAIVDSSYDSLDREFIYLSKKAGIIQLVAS